MECLVVKRQITYSCVFPAGKDNLMDILKIIPSKSSIAWLSYLLFKKGLMTSNQSELDFFIPLLFKMNAKLQREITDYLQYITDELENYVFLDKASLLILIEYILENHNENNEDILESKDDFSNLFIAYLICCDERIHYSTKDLASIKDADSQVLHHLPVQLKINDVIYPKDYRVEFIRFYCFMIFCEQDVEFKGYLKVFLKENQIEKWEDYLHFVLHIYLRNTTNEEGASNLMKIVPVRSYQKKLLHTMSIDINSFKRTADFTGLRSKPIYCHGNNLYSIIFSNFFIDKMFQSFLFDLASTLKEKGMNKIKNYPQFKQLVGERFTEKYLFYEIIGGCFSKTYKKLISGDELRKKIGDGEPDFYIRKGKNIFLFEFKDVMLNAKIKHCGNLEEIQREFLQSFELKTIEKSGKNQKHKDKGITQLLNVIENYLTTIFQNLDRFEITDRFNVYPIIVYQDPCFDIEGFRYLLNDRFEKLKQSRIISEDCFVKEFVMIPLEILIKLEDYFADGILQLDILIDNYIVECKKSEQNKLLPFNKYIMRQAKEKGYRERKSSRFQNILNSFVEKKMN